MIKKNSSMDGFIPRRAGSELGQHHQDGRVLNSASGIPRRKELRSENDLTSDDSIGQPRAGRALGRQAEPIETSRFAKVHTPRNDIAASLNEIDDPDQQPKKKLSRKDRRRLKKQTRTRAQKIRRRIIFGVIWVIVAAILAIGGWVVYRALNASSQVLQGNIFDIVQNQPLKEDANGRSNFLVFGTAEDDEGGMHGGANLTDSIMVISVDQDKKDAYMVSLPRDLWVRYDMPDGGACTVGYEGKLNAQYFCASDDGTNEEAGANALSSKVADVTGLEIQYYIHLNFTAVVEAVDAVGGVDITIPDYDPNSPGILDRNFDWKCRYQCYYVNYTDGERAHMDGEHALAFSRARNAAGGYGLPQGNFDREKNQQLVIQALREKAVSAGTLTNLGAVTGLIDALGNNLRTNIQTNEIRTLMSLGTDIPSESINSVSLNAEGESLVTTGMYNGQSIVRPIAGIMDYSAIHAYIKKEISSEPFVKEEASVLIMNGSGVSGVAQTLSDQLSDLGFTIGGIDNAPEGTYQAIEIYQIASDKPATATKLGSLYGVQVRTTAPPVSVVGDTDYLIIIGDAAIVERETR
jgi:polyisoprenyl-teichoic acid--peptidoglycan teichoic acid transferase